MRYPEKYVKPDGCQKIWASGYISDMHEKWISDDHFSLVASIGRFPRYKNKRGFDPQVKLFMDQENIKYEKSWDLPIPNGEAAYKSLAKYGKSEVLMCDDDVAALNKAWKWTSRQFYPYMCESRVLTREEAVSKLDMSTSSGSPFNQLYPTKRELFELDPDIEEWLDKDWELLGHDDLWTTIFSSSLKEELRPVEKIKENSQRTFAAGATDATVHGTRLFADMNEKMYDSHLKTASAIGMSPLKGNWHKLYCKLSVFDKGYALDETQYDSSLRTFLMWGCAKFRWSCLRQEDQTKENFHRLRVYYRNLINTMMLTPDGILMLKKLGNPSGSVNTVSDNTLILYTMMAFAWIKLSPPEMNDYVSFEDHTAKALLGDDNTWTVSDSGHEFYNGPAVIESWKLLGIITTTDSLEPRRPEELDFLSAHTVFMDGMAVPLYDRNKLMQSILYAPTSHLTPETTLQRVTNLLQIGWTDLPFRKFCRQLIAWLLLKYDDVLCNDARWIVAKAGIQNDQTLYALFTGRKVVLRPQSLFGEQEGTTPNKVEMNSALSVQGTKANKRARRGRQRRARQVQPGKAIVIKAASVPVGRTVNRSRRRRRAGRRGPRRVGQVGVGNTSSRSGNKSQMTISESEFIGAVTVANQPNFNVTSYSVNPGNSRTFPWLSTIAKNFERYQFTRLNFIYKKEVSEFAQGGQTGKVIMSFDFDASDPAPTTKQQMEDTVPHSDAMPCQSFALNLAGADMRFPRSLAKYIRVAGLPGSSDIKTYDLGNFNIATQGILSNTEVGELHVNYTVVLEKPILEASAAPANNTIAWWHSNGNEAATGSGSADTIVFGTQVQNPLGITKDPTGNFTLPPGNYLVHVWVGFHDNTNEAFAGTMSFQQNSADLQTITPSFAVGGAVGGEEMPLFQTAYVTAAVGDTFRVEVTPTGAAGTFQYYATIHFQVV